MKYLIGGLLLGVMAVGCKEKEAETSTIQQRDLQEAFKTLWYGGKAEITSYTLQQARYGEMRDGEAELIFVTEDFSTDKLVKLDKPDSTIDKVRVMKMNFMKKFITGIYPYSMMTSAFTPIEEMDNTLKITCSSQEWCGHTFSQMEKKGTGYDFTLHSYFESEGEQRKNIPAGFTEDGFWNLIRIDPSTLPIGEQRVIPAAMYLRLSHNAMEYQQAQLSLEKKDSTISIYAINYPALQRTIRIHFANVFPYEIIGWEESYPDGFGANKKMLTTTATKKKTIWLDYWKYNNNESLRYRDSLQLKKYE